MFCFSKMFTENKFINFDEKFFIVEAQEAQEEIFFQTFLFIYIF